MSCELLLSSDDLVDLEPSTSRLEPGMRLGRYELLAPVATGGMATVWAARLVGQHGFTKLVAIKTILPQLARELLFEQMFLEEARIASSIHHPNVCEVYEFGEDHGILYLAMEWVGGDSLAHVIGKSSARPLALEVRTAARVIADACAGLSAAHDLVDYEGRSLRIVHRDVSAQNILLSENGVVKLADFGVAKALSRSNETSTSTLKGKISYMAPEYIESGKVDRRIDVYSMGVVLYEATLGRQPFEGDRDAAIMEAIIRGAPPKPREVLAGYPRELEWIVLRALARDRTARFDSAEALRIALEEWLARSGPPVMQSAVATVVGTRVGGNIDDRRAHIRETMRRLDDEAPISASGGRPSPLRSGAYPKTSQEAIELALPDEAELPEQTAIGAPLFSSAPPAPMAFEAPVRMWAGETQRRQAATVVAPRPKRTSIILGVVAVGMCFALGVMGTQVLRSRGAGAGGRVEGEMKARVGESAGAKAGAGARVSAGAVVSAEPGTGTGTGEMIELPDTPTEIVPAVSASVSATVARPVPQLPPNPY